MLQFKCSYSSNSLKFLLYDNFVFMLVYDNFVRTMKGFSRSDTCTIYDYLYMVKNAPSWIWKVPLTSGQQTHCEMQSGMATAAVACGPELCALLCFCLAVWPDPSIPSSLCAWVSSSLLHQLQPERSLYDYPKWCCRFHH